MLLAQLLDDHLVVLAHRLVVFLAALARSLVRLGRLGRELLDARGKLLDHARDEELLAGARHDSKGTRTLSSKEPARTDSSQPKWRHGVSRLVSRVVDSRLLFRLNVSRLFGVSRV